MDAPKFRFLVETKFSATFEVEVEAEDGEAAMEIVNGWKPAELWKHLKSDMFEADELEALDACPRDDQKMEFWPELESGWPATVTPPPIRVLGTYKNARAHQKQIKALLKVWLDENPQAGLTLEMFDMHEKLVS